MSVNKKSYYKSAFSFLFSLIKPYKKWYAAAVAVSAALIGVNLLQTNATSRLVDNSSSGSVEKILLSIAGFLSLVAVNVTLTWLESMSAGKLSAFCGRDMKNRAAFRLVNAEYGEVVRLKSGDAVSTLNSDMGAVIGFISGDLINLFSQIAMAAAALIYLAAVNPVLCAVTFIYTPVGIFFTMTLNKKRNVLYPQNTDMKGEALSLVEQALSCIPVIKSFLMERRIVRQVGSAYNRVYENDMRISVYNALIQPACSSTAQIPRLIYLIYAGSMVMGGRLSVGAFVAVYSLLDYIIGPTVNLPFMLNSLNRTVASINRIMRMENLPQHEKVCNPGTFSGKPYIKVSDVSFSFGDGKQVLRDISFEAYGSGIVLLKGESGSGKTTLLDLLSGLYRPQKGRIEICGLNPYSSNICGIISVVSQDIYLFPASIRENIRCVRPESTDAEVETAAACAGAHGFIAELKDGYETVVGDGHTGLSGGQKQRIAFAQAILKNAPVWLLDEPTSALDSVTESTVIDAIKQASKEKLIVVSAHRQSLLDLSDRALVLERAVALESGVRV